MKMVHRLLLIVDVFARMKPNDKKFIVTNLQENSIAAPLSNNLNFFNYFLATKRKENSMTAMFCGDGANDMAALRAANVGVSLCEAETSVAAPITSQDQTPGDLL